ncbi:MAG: class I SAM-dependent methyltransferase [Chloroflexota bacterium]
MTHRMYADLAWAWPVISPPADYVSEAGQIIKLIKKYARRPVHRLLHLGCGGGHLDFTLKLDFAVTGVDLSPQMLDLARKLNPQVTYQCGDMRTIRLDQRFDAVLVADSIDYMLDEADLQAACQTAHAHLAPGGVLCLLPDVTAESFEQHETGAYTETSEDGAAITILRNHFDPDPQDTTFEMTFVYLIRRNGLLNIETDRHLAGIFPTAVWLRSLKQSGFSAKTVHVNKHAPRFVGIRNQR